MYIYIFFQTHVNIFAVYILQSETSDTKAMTTLKFKRLLNCPSRALHQVGFVSPKPRPVPPGFYHKVIVICCDSICSTPWCKEKMLLHLRGCNWLGTLWDTIGWELCVPQASPQEWRENYLSTCNPFQHNHGWEALT